ncbi:MAG: right-handed parallel beta-helix repeat-containing protein [Planctomycetaceae bacterium]
MSFVKDFGVAGDGKTDDTRALQHVLDHGDGILELPRGDYRITKTLTVDLAKKGRTGIHGSGGTAKLIMNGPGPAIFLKGTHSKTADPSGFRPEEWQQERMPTVANLEIEGRHPEANGIRIVGVMQPTLTGVLIRKVHTAVHITDRARNLIVSHCHFYHNTGVGLHLDAVNLHQAIVTGSHISYCRLGGIRVEKSEIRNFQITGNDIEYNNNRAHKVPNADDIPTAEIYLDVREGSVREGTICSNTIQATYSPNGANIRMIGQGQDANHKVGMWTISGNLIGSQDVNVHLTSARGVTITGNYIYSGHQRNLLVENSRNIVVGSNCFGHNPDYRKNELCTGLRFVDSVDCLLTGVLIQDCQAGKHTVPNAVELKRDGLLELVRCERINISGSQVIDSAPYGILLKDCRDTIITGTTVLDSRAKKKMQAAIHWTGAGSGNMISQCRIGKGAKAAILAEKHVHQAGNLFDE